MYYTNHLILWLFMNNQQCGG